VISAPFRAGANKNDWVRYNLGKALGREGDLNGMIAEYREALRLKPNSADAHYNLGFALEHMHNPLEALKEYRTAYELEPQNLDYREAYERLLQQVNQL
jgi:Flp pilus assembly protein TadD